MDERITLLYVDDEPINLRLFEINFRKKYNVITSISGDEGLKQLELNQCIKITVSDMKMPGMNGIEFIRRAKVKYPETVFFILTGYDITDEILKALNNNLIYKYFRKPLNMKEMEFSLEEAKRSLLDKPGLNC